MLLPKMTAGGAALGGTVGAALGTIVDKRAEISSTLESVGSKLRSFILGAGLALSTDPSVPTTPTNPCGDQPPPEQTTTQQPQGAPEDSGKRVITLERKGCK